jgi:hypothetical protein
VGEEASWEISLVENLEMDFSLLIISQTDVDNYLEMLIYEEKQT